MKTLKSIMLGLGLLVIAGAANAAKLNNDEPMSSDYVLKTYIAAVAEGNTAGFEKILDRNVSFASVRGDNVTTISKDDMVKGLKANEGVKQDCTSTTSVVSQSSESTVYEIDLKYADYTRVNIVTLVGSEQTGWKIQNVQTSVK